MAGQSQISAQVSSATKDKLSKFLQKQGLKQNFVVEQAILFFMEARQALPEDAFIPPKLVLDEEGFEKIVALVADSPAPTSTLKKLLNGD